MLNLIMLEAKPFCTSFDFSSYPLLLLQSEFESQRKLWPYYRLWANKEDVLHYKFLSFLKKLGVIKTQAAKSQETTCAISYDFADWVLHHWGHCSSAQIKQQVSQPTSLTPDLR